EGYLERRSRRNEGAWRRRWFLLKDGALSYFRNEAEAMAHRTEDDQSSHNPSPRHVIPLHRVEAVRTGDEFGPLAFRVISTDRDDLVLRAATRDEMHEWTFGFHRILANIIARL
ncbi:unnamed protein product, partial [Phaeothamnion confervicola]